MSYFHTLFPFAVCRWFNRWRERSRVQFTFGVWQEQQVKQQQRSVISGSSNSFSNTATLRALQAMPVNLTSDAPLRTPSASANGGGANNSGGNGTSDGNNSRKKCRKAEGVESDAMVVDEKEKETDKSNGSNNSGAIEENIGDDDNEEDKEDECEEGEEGEEGGDVSSDDEYDDDDYNEVNTEAAAATLAEKKKKRAEYLAMRRRVSLRWPCPYSYCLQHVVTSEYEGYYCPPIPVVEDPAAVADALKCALNEQKNAASGDSNSATEWLCIYKRVSKATQQEITTGKRKLEEQS